MTVPGEECSRRSLGLWWFYIELELEWQRDQTPVPELLLMLCDILLSSNSHILSLHFPSWFHGILGMSSL